MYAVTVNPVGEVEIRNYPADNSLAFLQSCVGGYVEVVDFDFRDFSASLWLNEEGKFQNLAYNVFATSLVASQIMPHDYIVGDCVITGLPDDEGNTTGLTFEQAIFLHDYFTFR